MENKIRELRVKIDCVCKILKEFIDEKNDITQIEKSYNSIVLAVGWINQIAKELGYEEQDDFYSITQIKTMWNFNKLSYYGEIEFIINEITSISEEILEINSGKMVVQDWTSNWNNLCDISKNQAFIQTTHAIFFLRPHLIKINEIFENGKEYLKQVQDENT